MKCKFLLTTLSYLIRQLYFQSELFMQHRCFCNICKQKVLIFLNHLVFIITKTCLKLCKMDILNLVCDNILCCQTNLSNY